MPFVIATSPFLPIPIIIGFVIAFVTIQIFAYLRLKRINLFHALAFSVMVIFTINPQIVDLVKKDKPQKIIIIKDYSASIIASNRIDGINFANQNLKKQIEKAKNIEIIEGEISPNSQITNFSKALEEITNNINENDIAAAVFITDGLGIDKNEIARPYPIHQILIGNQNEKDAYIELLEAPKPNKIGEISKAKIIVKTQNIDEKTARLNITMAGLSPYQINVPTNKSYDIEFRIQSNASIPIAIEILPYKDEISIANNAIITNLEGIADRLRVLLVTGEPYEGTRAWRNLFKSDPAIDLVHFTILRSPEKEDYTNEEEVSLIPFPTEELFIDKLDEFDLVVFDRFQNLVGLRDEYFQNVSRYVKTGGALLVAFGPKDAEGKGVLSTSLGEIIPINQTPQMIDNDFYPTLTEKGLHHTITQNLNQKWGKWDRIFKTTSNANILMKAGENPLLIVNQVEKGRIALILSDKSWYWQRGFDGGGPFRELIGRTSHWLMKDPALADKYLKIKDNPNDIKIDYFGQTNGQKMHIFGPNQNFEIAPNENDTFQMSYIVNSPNYGLYKIIMSDAFGFIIHGAKGETYNNFLNVSPKTIKNISDNNGGGNYFYVGSDGKGQIGEITTIENLIFAKSNQIFLRKIKNNQNIEVARRPILPQWLYALLLVLFLIISYSGRKFYRRTKD